MLAVLGDSGPAVLLLPGGAEAVEGFFPGLADGLMADPGCRVIFYDRPGTVGSEIDGPLSGATEAIHATLAGLGVGPVVVIGQSLGGAVAALPARDHPEDVAGLVLLDPSPVNDAAMAKKVERTTRTMVRLFGLPLLGRMLSWLLRASAVRSARRHAASPGVRAAMLELTDLAISQLGRAIVGFEAIARGFTESQLPRVPATVVTADRKH